MLTKTRPVDVTSLNSVGRSYYCFCLEQALIAVAQAHELVRGDVIERNHEIVKIRKLLSDALEAS